MPKCRNRGGSALLIVLGLVTFMVASAVGFSVYMRQTRLPSSYLRRTTMAHELARAALAEAMYEIDDSIRSANNAIAPNIGGVRNVWKGRVLTPNGSDSVAERDTVTPLAFESLAYIPAPLVNEVRYWSRHSSTAEWGRFDFDAGRYAFCAVNVSDYFDLNRIAPGKPRGSGDDCLVTPTYLFQNGEYTSFDKDPLAFQDFIDDVKSSDEGDFVSVADYNLALKSLGSGTGIQSPFAKYIEENGTGGFYGSLGSGEGDSRFREVAMQRFITDSHSELSREEWVTSEGRTPFDISRSENQPFPTLLNSDSPDSNDHSVDSVTNPSNPFWDAYIDDFDPSEEMALYDYLDADDVPLTVAAPTVERTPMFVAVEGNPVDFSARVTEREKDKSESSSGGVYEERKTVEYVVSFQGLFGLNVGLVFPFKWQNARNSAAGSFKVTAQGAFFLESLGSRSAAGGGANGTGCRTPKDGALANWPKARDAQGAEYRDGCVVMTSNEKPVRLPSSAIRDQEDAVLSDVELDFPTMDAVNSSFEDPANVLARYYLYRRYTIGKNGQRNYQTGAAGDDGWILDPTKNDGRAEFGLKSLDFADGTVKDGAAGRYTWGLAVSVALRNDSGKLVDMSPAHPSDDDTPAGSFGTRPVGNLKRSLLRFDLEGDPFVELEDGFSGYKKMNAAFGASPREELKFSPKAYFTDDPRYNYAAENWWRFAGNTGTSLGRTWLDDVKGRLGNGGRDGDIFMSVSNQGYLQDAGELAMLPRVSGLRNGDPDCRVIINAMDGRIPGSAGDCGNAGQMWRTYDCMSSGDDRTSVDTLKITTPVRGFRASPYTDDDTIRLGVFMHTPYDWWSAGTNVNDTVKRTFMDADGYATDMNTALKYTFGPLGEGAARVSADTLADLSDEVGKKFLARGDGKWYEAWRELWTSGKIEECLDGLKLHDVDRKFLFSYWRKCFANSQQLFLVFFRAEPVVLGGGAGEGSTPAQLGAKGLAVVWRNPSGPSDRPHQMRVLFYHQMK